VFQTWRPHFIWMDLRMPVIDGKEAIRRIRASDGGLDVRIAAVTASAFVSEREEVLAAGADDFIRKPYQRSEIFECMARHLGLRRIYEKPQQETQTLIPDLHTLPPHLVHQLAEAVVTLDQRRILEVIVRISECDKTIAEKLTYFAKGHTYTSILTATEEYGKNSR
jgi:CheY-like chemotaxis protein